MGMGWLTLFAVGVGGLASRLGVFQKTGRASIGDVGELLLWHGIQVGSPTSYRNRHDGARLPALFPTL